MKEEIAHCEFPVSKPCVVPADAQELCVDWWNELMNEYLDEEQTITIQTRDTELVKWFDYYTKYVVIKIMSANTIANDF